MGATILCYLHVLPVQKYIYPHHMNDNFETYIVQVNGCLRGLMEVCLLPDLKRMALPGGRFPTCIDHFLLHISLSEAQSESSDQASVIGYDSVNPALAWTSGRELRNTKSSIIQVKAIIPGLLVGDVDYSFVNTLPGQGYSSSKSSATQSYQCMLGLFLFQ